MHEAETIGFADTEGPTARHLDRLAATATTTIAAETVAVVAAHPDDETIGVGGRLPRLAGVSIVHVTDGAPRNLEDARAAGFGDCASYAAARRRELEAAMAMAGIPPERLYTLGAVDQEAGLALADLSHGLAALLQDLGTEIVLTHPYEGGHPDHDATCFIVHAARRLIAISGGAPPVIIEMTSYHAGPDGMVVQRFLPEPDCPELILHLTADQRALKQRMIDAHGTQRAVLAPFGTEDERFRPAPHYDFTMPPNGGRLHYEQFGWGMTGRRWSDLASRAQAALGWGPTP